MILGKFLKEMRQNKILKKYNKLKGFKIEYLDIPINSNLDIAPTAKGYIKKLTVNENVNLRIRNNSRLEIESDVYFNNGCILTCRDFIKIGSKCSFGPNVMIFDHDHDINADDYRNKYISKEIIIGNNVWIGANSIILKGTTIGDNSVIAAGSIVKGNIPQNVIYYNQITPRIKKIKE